MAQRIAKEIEEEIVEQLKAGKTQVEIARMLSLHQSTVSIAALRNGLRIGQRKVCEKCGKTVGVQDARYCCYCGNMILTEREKITEKAESLFRWVSFVPETNRDAMQETIKDIISYIEKEDN